MPNYAFDGYVDVGIWAYKNDVWVKVTTDSFYVGGGGGYTQAGPFDFNFSRDVIFALGTGVRFVGLTIEAYTGNSAYISSFSNLIWQSTPSSGGIRSATPAGQKSTVSVRP